MQTQNFVSLDTSSADFLAQLANDENLRAAVKRDPVGTLAEFGIEMDPADVPAAVELPTAENLSRTVLNSAASSQTSVTVLWNPFILGD